MEDLFHKLLILRMPGVGPVKYNALIQKFGTAQAACAGLAPSPEFIDSVRREMDSAHAQNIHYLTEDDARYPERLRAVKNHPIIISARGNLDALSRPSIGMVGTRHATGAGMKFMAELAAAFASRGFSVVSGMAIGTDTAAHLGALRSDNSAATIAVLAGGVDYIWPPENERLYHQIIERGCVISEMPVGFAPNATHFVRRNQGIAALSDKLILGEADMKSGSMHTARFAIDYKKQVFAIPLHPSDARSVGPNTLIREGLATLCMGIDDFFDAPRAMAGAEKRIDSDIESYLGMIPLSESVLSELAKKSVMEIKRDLVMAELAGTVRKVDGGYVRN